MANLSSSISLPRHFSAFADDFTNRKILKSLLCDSVSTFSPASNLNQTNLKGLGQLWCDDGNLEKTV